MEDKELDQLLKNALSMEYEPKQDLNEKILKRIGENLKMNKRKVRKLPVAAAVFFAVMCCTVTAFAAWNFLTPNDIAREYGDKKLAAAFESKEAILMQESQTYGKYKVSLLGVTSGKDLSDFCEKGEKPNSGKTYAVVAIAKKDGTPMPDTSDESYGRESFFVSPLIQTLNPAEYNIATMHGGYIEIVRSGVMYRIIECDTIELFADKALYLCVSNTNFFDGKAYVFDEKSGTISKNEEYEGMNLLFHLPLEKDKADKKAAEAYLKKLKEEAAHEGEEFKNEAEENIKFPDIKELKKDWKLISEKEVAPDKDGRIYYSYEGNSGAGDAFVTLDSIFDEGETGYSKNIFITEDDNWKNAIVFYREKAGDILVSVYEIKK